MATTYITMGQSHLHRINGTTIDPDCVVRIKTTDKATGRERAFELFGDKFSFEYHEGEWNHDDIKYFPRGYIDLE